LNIASVHAEPARQQCERKRCNESPWCPCCHCCCCCCQVCAALEYRPPCWLMVPLVAALQQHLGLLTPADLAGVLIFVCGESRTVVRGGGGSVVQVYEPVYAVPVSIHVDTSTYTFTITVCSANVHGVRLRWSSPDHVVLPYPTRHTPSTPAPPPHPPPPPPVSCPPCRSWATAPQTPMHGARRRWSASPLITSFFLAPAPPPHTASPPPPALQVACPPFKSWATAPQTPGCVCGVRSAAGTSPA
jgi:hypothetical protein